MIKALSEDKIALKEYVDFVNDDLETLNESYNANDMEQVVDNLNSLISNSKELKDQVIAILEWGKRK